MPAGNQFDFPSMQFMTSQRAQNLLGVLQMRSTLRQTDAAVGNPKVIADPPQRMDGRRLPLIFGALNERQIGYQVFQQFPIRIGHQKLLGTGKV